MMVKMDSAKEHMFPLKQWLPAVIIGLVYIALGALIVSADPDFKIILKAALAAPGEFAQYLFAKHWLSIEIVSLLLLIALIGALHLGRKKGKKEIEDNP